MDAATKEDPITDYSWALDTKQHILTKDRTEEKKQRVAYHEEVILNFELFYFSS